MDRELEAAAECLLSARPGGGAEFALQPDGSMTCALTRSDGLPWDFVPDAAMQDPAALDNPLIVVMIFFGILLVAWIAGEIRSRL